MFKNLISIVGLVMMYSCHTKQPGAYQMVDNNAQVVQTCKDSVSAWIRKYALYPESYHPISWGDLNLANQGTQTIRSEELSGVKHVSALGKEIKPLRLYRVIHSYELKNKDGALTRYTNEFELQYDFHIQGIGEQMGWLSYVVYPDDILDWLKMNGRPLSPEDTTDRLTPYRKALWAYNFELDTVRDRWGWPSERTDTMVVKSIDSLYVVYFGKMY